VTAVAEGSPALRAVAAAVEKGECILFLGAAVHCGPPDSSPFTYPPEERPPLGSAFSKSLVEKLEKYRELAKESETNLQRVSLFYEVEKSRNDLVTEIDGAVQRGKRPSPVVRALAQLDFPLVVTTNYDRLFERALTLAEKDPIVAVYSRDQMPTRDYPGTMPTPDRPFVFKIHGDVGDPASIVVTEEDYIHFVLRMQDDKPYNPVPQTFHYLFQKWTTLFVGYSLLDYNLRLLFKTLRWKIDKAYIPDTYSVDLYPDPLIVDVWHNQEKYVKFVVEDVWKFVPDLYRLVKKEEMPDYRGG
jgi:SIR2-like protein